jgi:hypothetical protein
MIPTHRHEMLIELTKIARDLEDGILLGAVRRLIEADRKGRFNQADRADKALAMEAAESFL